MRRLALVLLVVAAALVTAVARRSPPVAGWPDNNDKASLKFSHAFHVGEAAVACLDCHKGASTSTSSSDNLRPAHDNCVTCHEEQVNKQCGYCHRDTLNIQAAVRPVRTIVFSHAKHTAMKSVECATCHPGLDKTEYAGPANMPAMATCVTCHDNARATGTCESCHANFVNLVPSDHLVADFRKDHKKLTRLGGLDVSCATCHTQNFCADCHGAAPLERFGRSALMSEPSPRSSSTSNGPRQMTLQMTHSMNYRYTHGIDAKAKSTECFDCHNARTFCEQCHAVGDNLTPGLKPASHLAPGFTTFGVGSGGGGHARLALRDIESCAACHDVQGADPTCMLCHKENGAVR
jgi:c(7)-type cytochrome triheme protein